jgi:hypothetical protein
MADLPKITLIKEAIPSAPKRAGGAGRTATPWEEVLQPVRDDSTDKDGKPILDAEGKPASYRIWTYDTRNGANGRVATVRDRLRNHAPELNYGFVVRTVPEGQDDQGRWGVYVSFLGTFTPKQQAENAAKHKAASDRVKRSQEAAEAAKAAESGETGETVDAKADTGKAGKNAA